MNKRTLILQIVAALAALLSYGCATSLSTGGGAADDPIPASVGDVTSADAGSPPSTREQPVLPAPELPKAVIRYLPERIERRLANGVLDFYLVRTYRPESADLISEETFIADDEVHKIRRYQYGDNGHVTIVTETRAEGVESRVVKTFDDSGRLVYEDQLNADGEPELSFAWEYDGPLLSRWDLIDSGGTVISFSTYEYGDDRLERIVNHNRGGAPEEYVVFRYDSVGRLISEIVQDASDGAELSKTTYRYDGDGRLVEEGQTGPGLLRKTQRTYDEHGLVVREDVFGRGDTLLFATTYRYIAVEIPTGR